MEFTATAVTEGARPREPERQPPIEDYALIGDLCTAALVSRSGSIDFLCLPDFDSDACFTALLGTPENGRWKIAPRAPVRSTRRRYRGNSLVLETEFETDSGTVRLVDFMPIRQKTPRVVRWIEGVSGEVPMHAQLCSRFACGLTVPRMRMHDGVASAIAGPDALYLTASEGTPASFDADFVIRAGERIAYALSWAHPYAPIPERIDWDATLAETEAFWTDWAQKITLPGLYGSIVMRSLITLKACTYRPSGAMVAAPTFGLPETLGGERNWDYRYCWIRDAALTVNAFLRAGLLEEARAFGSWLELAMAGAHSDMQIMYGIRGERRLTEVTLDWLKGYQGARPVRVGNGAYSQFQLDVLGEFAVVLFTNAQLRGELTPLARETLEALATTVSRSWRRQDHGIWEMRGPKRSFTASKVAAWATVDRWIKAIDTFKLDVDKQPWQRLRQTIFDEVCAKGYDPVRNTFTQYYGSENLDASLLGIVMFGMLPAKDPRVVGTVRAIEEDLMQDGLVLRYRTDESDDGLIGEEGVFLACSFWLAFTYAELGQQEDSRRLFERVVGVANDLGLLAEEYLPSEQRLVGNFPQAFSHLALVNCAYALADSERTRRSPKDTPLTQA
jgi:GH15 family glucan-1,4-alpha-glucosidase